MMSMITTVQLVHSPAWERVSVYSLTHQEKPRLREYRHLEMR